MADGARMQMVVGELGPGWDEVLAVARSTSTSWGILLRDRQAVGLLHESEAGRVVVRATVDAPAEAHAAAVHEAMLSYNMLAAEAGGLRIGLDAERDIEISVELVEARLDLAALRRVVGHVADTARAWKRFAADPGGTDAVLPEFLIRG